ncbi:PREDICTED: protein suppressor of hairy wing-like isoform X2 [Nicrophorus vespilloides]|nr:PREDICTED: protein suppressor of hairy wing-like isoform X2 [Nicrophorus vespilloides]XP_017781422.1 PREDICTED: protein suppressor of hairy wing-like isoform X2 [Nicrophorus vespilloides]XP_017781423.1 PREDICTED: protein suppressor of hairy wing-like isoform X2 [Nicrophorus vespilloides]
MEETSQATQLQVIGKLEPVACEEDDAEEVGMKEMEIYNHSDQQVIEEIHVSNTDGNLHINTYEVQEEVIDNSEYEEGSETHHVIITEDGTFLEQHQVYVEEEVQDYEEEAQEFEEAQYEEAEYVEGEEMEEDDPDEDAQYVQEEDEVETIYMEQDDHDSDTAGDEDPDDPDFNVEEEDQDQKDEINPCTICLRSFKTTASLKRHITVAHGQEEYTNDEDPLAFELCACCGEPIDSAHTTGSIKCTHCDNKLFDMQSNLSRHISLEHPDEKGVYKCCECARTFLSHAAILKHMQSHPLAKPYSCKACNRDFTRKYHLERHVAQTGCDGQPRSLFKCEVCKKTFTRKDNLRDHLRAHAGQIKKKKVFTCSYCKKEFMGSALLAVHVRTHTGEKPYPCDLCPKRFPSSGAMKKHRRMHTGEKPYQCMQCKRRFAAKETLNRHMRTHTGDKPHKCTYCGKAFIQAAQLRAHIFHHTGENAFTCPHCNRAFNRRIRLTTHIKFVHEGAEPMNCPEDNCDKTFYRKEDLARHLNLHSGEKPYECEHCKKRFAVKASLKLHALTHRKEQPCSCDECGRAFIRQDCLMRHMRSKHRDVLEDILAGAEKRRLQQQLLYAATDASSVTKKEITESQIWTELTLTDSIKELLGLLVDEKTLLGFGWPDAPIDKILDSVIKRCGHEPASDKEFDYISKMRENAKLLFTVVIDDQAVKSLLNNQTVDEVIQHVLRLAKNE